MPSSNTDWLEAYCAAMLAVNTTMRAKREALDALSTGHATEPEPRLDRKAVQ